MSILLPNNEHRICMRHLWKAFMKDFVGDFFEQVVCDVATSYTDFEIDMHMAKLKEVSEPVWKYLKERTQMWPRIQFFLLQVITT